MSKLSAWLQAARPLAQANIFFPLLFGEALAYGQTGRFSWVLFGWVHAFGLVDQLYIVFANDVADYRADAANRTFNRFSGGSRVIPEGKLSPLALAKAALLSALLLGGIGAYLTLRIGRPLMLVFASLAISLLWIYSFGPLRLSYRGRGELLQGLGVGIVLPLVGYYVQSGELTSYPWPALLAGFALGVAGNVATSLPDTPADRAAGKRSYPVRQGELSARRATLLLIAGAVAATPLFLQRLPLLPMALSMALPLGVLIASLKSLPDADSRHHPRCERFVLLAGGAITAAWLAWSIALFGAA